MIYLTNAYNLLILPFLMIGLLLLTILILTFYYYFIYFLLYYYFIIYLYFGLLGRVQDAIRFGRLECKKRMNCF